MSYKFNPFTGNFDDAGPTHTLTNVTNTTQQNYHGFVNRTSSTLAFNNTSHVLTLAVATTAQVYIGGVPYTLTGNYTADLDDYTLSVGLWYVWMQITGGVPVLAASKSPWSAIDTTIIPVATVYWTGGAGIIGDERHAHDRNLETHRYLHSTVGARIQNDGSFAQTLPSTGTGGQIQLTGGNLWDEELITAIDGPVIRCRVWYETAAATWTAVNGTDNSGKDRPYLWNAGTSRIQYPKSDSSYVLTDIPANNYWVSWVFASNDYDTSRAVYLVIPSGTAPLTSLANARLTVMPNLPFAAELKLLWRWIHRGDGVYQEAADYRNSSTLPGGGVTAPTAVSVSFSPPAGATATNVQAALEDSYSMDKITMSVISTQLGAL